MLLDNKRGEFIKAPIWKRFEWQYHFFCTNYYSVQQGDIFENGRAYCGPIIMRAYRNRIKSFTRVNFA